MTKRLDAAVTAGKLTAEQKQKLLDGLAEHIDDFVNGVHKARGFHRAWKGDEKPALPVDPPPADPASWERRPRPQPERPRHLKPREKPLLPKALPGRRLERFRGVRLSAISRLAAQSPQRPTMGKWLKRARKPVASSTDRRTPSSCSGGTARLAPQRSHTRYSRSRPART